MMDTPTPLHPCIFLIGLHGVGKTTLGRHLHQHHGWMHISLGDLGRLARSRRLPREHSTRFMGHLAAQLPGDRLSQPLIESLLGEIERHRQAGPVSVDGFPAEPFHMGLLPPGSLVFHLEVPDAQREERLLNRGEHTVRQWTGKAQGSNRDKDLPLLLELHRSQITSIDANVPVADVARQILLRLVSSIGN